jgi:hypothetical protein
VAAGFLLSVAFHRRIGKRKVNLTLVTFLWCLLIFLIQRVLPPARVFLPLLPLYVGSGAAGVGLVGAWITGRLPRKWKEAVMQPTFIPVACCALALLLGVTVIVRMTPYQPADQVRLREAENITMYLKGKLEPGDIVYVEPNIRKPLEYYFMKNGVPNSYLFFLEDREARRGNVRRAYVVSAEREGYPLEASMRSSNLKPETRMELKTVAQFPYATVYEIYNPPVREER